MLKGETNEFKLNQLFVSYDPHKAYVLHADEFAIMCDRLGLTTPPAMDEQVFLKAFQYIDTDRDGGVFFNEFKDFALNGPKFD